MPENTTNSSSIPNISPVKRRTPSKSECRKPSLGKRKSGDRLERHSNNANDGKKSKVSASRNVHNVDHGDASSSNCGQVAATTGWREKLIGKLVLLTKERIEDIGSFRLPVEDPSDLVRQYLVRRMMTRSALYSLLGCLMIIDQALEHPDSDEDDDDSNSGHDNEDDGYD